MDFATDHNPVHIIVLGSLESWYVKDLRRAAAGRHIITPHTFRGLASNLSPSSLDVLSGDGELLSADAVLVRTMPPGSLEQVVFRMDALGRLHEAGLVVVNPPRAIETAVDKYLATAKLRAAGLDVPPTWCGQLADDALRAFAQLGGDVVVKPLFGGEGRGITRISDPALAERAFRMLEQLGAVIYLQPFIEHEGFDLRLLVVGRRVLGIRRRSATDWRTNVSRGAVAEPLEVTEPLVELARRAADAVGAPLAGVDLLPAKDGRLYALEVNGVPGWQAVARTWNIDVADLVLKLLESCCG
ncbi:MAG: RimK family alpha-L-glutamate ligase [Planctomycetales bacterium]|nr:RimK family alpha-L-glutamate ligase [Planctomycetales bacterium]NIM09898.1 RimK family alpha-L-glutamate ligase [Planctomycetales bacterium]NIN09337.1 RimK family alpha-L-glutamate ligase [Planctomycetales bacterium]NIN78447.1 RimK family alpha-L-glutamate ligase [Planctomycetales bacterium]NIO35637.1 RimK family alpha-L-glutamate ligase [Planctomycetales bacterium]